MEGKTAPVRTTSIPTVQGRLAAVAGLFIFVVLVIIVSALASSGSATGQYDKLIRNGTPARGILLQVAAQGTKAGTAARRFEMRQVQIDVEIAGRPPYETNANVAIPINLVRDVLPGATVELRVDPNNTTRIAIVGPGTGLVQQALRTQ